MATSGSVSTGTVGSFYLTFNWSTNDTTVHNIYWEVVAHNTPGKYRSIYDKWVRINGVDYVNEYTSSGTSYYDGNVVASGSMTWGNDVGSISVEMGFGVGSYHGYNATASDSWGLNALVSTPTVTVSIGARTETTIAASMSVTNNGNASIVDNYIDLFTDSGCTNCVGTISGSSGTFTGLTHGTTYYVRANASNGTYRGYSSVPSTSTYYYPHVLTNGVSKTNLTIGEEQTLSIYNPLGRSITVYMKKDSTSGTQLYSGTTSASGNPISYKFTPTASTLYGSIPDSSSGNCVYYCVYSNQNVGTRTGTYKVSGNNAQAPTFTDFNYKDTDSQAVGLTGKSGVNNPGILISGMSNCEFTVSASQKATSSYGATLDKYNFAWLHGAGTSGTYSSSAAVTGTVQDGNTNKISVSAYDKRGQYKTVEKTITLISPTHAQGIVQADRQNGVNAATYLNGALSYWAGDWAAGSSRPNQLLTVEYRVNKTGSYYDITSAVTSNSTVTTDGNFKILTLNSNVIQLHANGSSGGFTVGTSYTVEIFVTTGYNSSNKYETRQKVAEITVTSGVFGMARYKGSDGKYHYGINGLPASNRTFKVNGTLESSGATYVGADGLYIGGVKAIWYA